MKKLCLLFILVLVVSNLSAQEIIITTQPVSLSQCVGEPASIFVIAESTKDAKLNFQWYKDGEMITDENAPVLNFSSLHHSHSGLYFCRVSLEDGSESVNSKFASVYALRPTSITKEPEDILTGSESDMVSLSFDAHVSGLGIDDAIQNGEYVKIQWFRVVDNLNLKLENNAIYYGVNSNKLNINTANLPDTTFYFAEIEGKCGIAHTRIVKVIKSLKLIELSIAGLDACEGIEYSLKAQITNPQNHKLEFQWYKDGKPIYFKENLNGSFSDELKFNPIDVNDAGKYKLEATIKEINYSGFSNEVDVNVGKLPKIVCIRLTPGIDHSQSTISTNFFYLDIFYEYDSHPITFDVYRDGNLIGSYLSSDSKWSLKNVFIIQTFLFHTDFSSKYWVIANNLCGTVYSDTISFHEQDFCDPFNQFQALCENDKWLLEIKYHPKSNTKYIYDWVFNKKYSTWIDIMPRNNIIVADSTKLIIPLKKYPYDDGGYNFLDFNYGYFDRLLYLDRNHVYDIFHYFYVKVKYLPVIIKQPLNKIVTYGTTDTLFKVFFNNESQKVINLSLYYMKNLDSKPRLIDSTIAEYGLWYHYIKDATFSDDGYYFALVEHPNDSIFDYYCNPLSTDTIKVTVASEGVVAGVKGNELNPGLIVTPNPSSDFITITLSNEGLQPFAESDKVQIFDVLGIEIKDLTPALSINGEGVRIDVSHLPAGVYFIRITCSNGACSIVEKFVKM